MLKLQEGQQVLDVGCGIGGSAFYMAEVRDPRISSASRHWHHVIQHSNYIGITSSNTRITLVSRHATL